MKEGTAGKGRVKGEVDAPHTDENQGAKLEEVSAKGIDSIVGQLSLLRGLLSQGIEQPVGEGREPQPQLRIIKVMVRGVVAEEVQLLFFEAIFHFPARAVAVGMEALSTHLLSAQGGDNKVVPHTVDPGGDFADQLTGSGTNRPRFGR